MSKELIINNKTMILDCITAALALQGQYNVRLDFLGTGQFFRVTIAEQGQYFGEGFDKREYILNESVFQLDRRDKEKKTEIQSLTKRLRELRN